MKLKNKKTRAMVFGLLGMALCMTFLMDPMVTLASNAALGEVKSQINLFVELLAAVVSGGGAAVTMWAFMKMGMAMQSGAQGGMEAQSFNAIIGGIIIILAPQLIVIFIT